MKIAIIGSRTVCVDNLESYIPSECTEIVSGGASSVDQCAAEFASRKQIKLTEFLPQYQRFGRGAPIVRNKKIVEYADAVMAFWDGKSKGTLWVIRYCEKINKPCQIMILPSKS